ncbi:MAG: DNA-directed RNA polymerase subunit beta, partial [Erysipelotrichia bacterium]|nr:DNA-directed RNA polymerase subunit beta [Erysipelotrichia bacterium]
MENKETYRVVHYGNKSTRRDYERVDAGLDLPDLTEIQTASFEWLLKEGIREVFEDIYPISNYAGNIKLKFLDYEFGEPKYSISECKFRETNYCAPLKAKMELEMVDPETGEVMTKWEEVFFGDFPLMSPTGTFIINGAERIIVSQIVRSPGAYFDIISEEHTGRDTYTCELIPSRGTWLEFMSDDKKAALGRIMNVSIDRRRKVFSTILFKAIGMSLNPEKGDDPFDTSAMKKFLRTMNFPIYEENVVPSEEREYLNDYALLYTSVFGNYPELINTLNADKTRTRDDALLSVYLNQRADEIATIDGSFQLMDAKFFDYRRYDLTKAGRYKVRKKLNILDRMEGHVLKSDLIGADGRVLLKKNRLVDKDIRNDLRDEINKGINMKAMPFIHRFSHPDVMTVPTSWTESLAGRILATDLDGKKVTYEQGTVLTPEDVKIIGKEFKEVSIYTGITANEAKVNNDTVNAVLNLGSRMYAIGRIVENGSDLKDAEGENLIARYIPDQDLGKITAAQRDAIVKAATVGKDVSIWLVGAAVQEVIIKDGDHEISLIGIDPLNDKHTITMSDMYALYNYELTMFDSVGNDDDIDM